MNLKIAKVKSDKIRHDGRKHNYNYAVHLILKDGKGKRYRKRIKTFRLKEDAIKFIASAKYSENY